MEPRPSHQHQYLVAIGLGAALLLLMLGLAAILALAFSGEGRLLGGIDERTGYVLRSALIQASLSVLFSLFLAIPSSIALNRTAGWRWTRMMRMMLGLALVIPTTVAAGGLIAIWGRKGLLASLCEPLFDMSGCGNITIYGLHGVILAHMFFNVPLLIRIFLPQLEAIPAAHHRLASQLNITGVARFRHIEWPQIRSAIPASALLVFLFCFTSFSLVLMLGGGPKVTTMEVEIYAAIRFSFDLVAASGLSLLQFACAALVVSVIAILNRKQPLVRTTQDMSLNLAETWSKSERSPLSFWIVLVHGLLGFLIILPVAMVIIKGLDPALAMVMERPIFWRALTTSLSIAIGSAIAVTSLAFVLAGARSGLIMRQQTSAPRKSIALVVLDGGIMLYLVIPAIVLGTSAFILLRSAGDVFAAAWMVVVAANTLLALPLAVRVLEPRMTRLFRQQDRLALMLGIDGMARWRMITLPLLEREIGLILGLSAALSVGDLGVIALFASQHFQTLPWMLYQATGRYAGDEAAALALLLLGVTVFLLMAGKSAARLFRFMEKVHA
ncbi:thiamine/thiamine pyrophosphate ABC transporter permease ThiP [Alphaproteobacteria bacterium LSUCC0684]